MRGRIRTSVLGVALASVFAGLTSCGESGGDAKGTADGTSLATNQGGPANGSSDAAPGAADRTRRERVGSFDVVARSGENAETTRVEIEKAGNVYWSRAGTSLSTTGVHAPGSPAIAPGSDVTGDGLPNLILREAAATGTRFIVLRLGEEVDVLAEIDAGPGADAGFRDLDGDGIFEFVGRDPTWRDILADRSPRVVLRWSGSAYVASPADLARPEPRMDQLEPVIERILLSDAWTEAGPPKDLWVEALDLAFSGHPETASRLIEWAWPDGRAGREAFLDRFRATLAQSERYRELTGS